MPIKPKHNNGLKIKNKKIEKNVINLKNVKPDTERKKFEAKTADFEPEVEAKANDDLKEGEMKDAESDNKEGKANEQGVNGKIKSGKKALKLGK